MKRTMLTPEQIRDVFSRKFGEEIREIEIREWEEGARKKKIVSIWMRMSRDILHDSIARLIEIDYPHLSVISGSDLGEEVELLYHMSIYFGVKNGEILVTFAVPVPKSDFRIPTISDLIPGAVYSEREKQDFFGLEVTGIPDSRRLFLPEDFPEGVYPWRKDETGIPEEMINELWRAGRPTDRPAPPVREKEEEQPEKEEKKPENAPEPQKAEEPAQGGEAQ